MVMVKSVCLMGGGGCGGEVFDCTTANLQSFIVMTTELITVNWISLCICTENTLNRVKQSPAKMYPVFQSAAQQQNSKWLHFNNYNTISESMYFIL